MGEISIMADPHLGAPGRLDDIIWSMKVVREYNHRAKIDTTVIAGDLFHDREAVGLDVLNAACEFFEETKEEYKQEWITFPGNHDMFLRHSWQNSAVAPLRKHLRVIDTVKILMIEDTRFWILPFVTFEKSFMTILSSIERQYKHGDKLFTHIGVCGSQLNSCFTLKDWSVVDFTRSAFDKVFTGHFHIKQQVGENVFYPGSPIAFNHSEGNHPHGFYVYNLEKNEQKFINILKAGSKLLPIDNPPPEFNTITDDMMGDVDVSAFQNAHVRVALCKHYTTDEKKDIKAMIEKQGALSVTLMNRVKDEVPAALQDVTFQMPAGMDLFTAWINADTKGIKDLNLKVLARCNADIVREGDELYALEESDSIGM